MICDIQIRRGPERQHNPYQSQAPGENDTNSIPERNAIPSVCCSV